MRLLPHRLTILPWLTMLAISALTQTAYAEKADSEKPTEIYADRTLRDGKKDPALKAVTTLSGNVVVSRGTLLVKAARAVINTALDDSQKIHLYSLPGGRVSFRQKRDGGPDLWIEGEADKAEYDDRTELVKFISKAKVRYLDGKKVTDQMEGEFLSYDSRNDVFVGSNTSSGESVEGAERVKIVIQPRNEKQAK